MTGLFKLCPIVYLALTSFQLKSQTDTIYSYFDKDWKEIESTEEYTYYRKAYKTESLWTVNDYFSSGQIQMKAQFSDSEFEIYEGICSWYFRTGKIARKGSYQNGKRNGKWQINDATCVVESYGNYKNGERTGTWNYVWNNNYSGSRIFDKDSIIHAEYYKNGKPIKEYPSREAQYPGGYEKMYQFLYSTIEYPKLARNAGIQGRVFVEFVVDENGNVKNVRLIKGIGGGCDEQALEAVRSLPKWTPAEMFETRVQQRFKLPIKFELVDDLPKEKKRKRKRKSNC